MAIGTVKWFDLTKGFGFIQPEGSGKDVFVHITALKAANINTLAEGQKVGYELTTNNGKVSATDLKLK